MIEKLIDGHSKTSKQYMGVHSIKSSFHLCPSATSYPLQRNQFAVMKTQECMF